MIGIVSGIGPLAGSDVLAKVFKYAAEHYSAVEDNEYPDTLMISKGIKGVDNNGTLSSEFETEIVDMIKQLENQAASVIGIACNTAHIYLNKIKPKATTKLINLIDEVAVEAAKTKQNYLLLTSTSSKKQKLYQSYLKKYNVNFIETDDSQQAVLDNVIGLVMAHRLDEAGKQMEKLLIEIKQQGIDSIIAGCTELPIALRQCNIKALLVIDSNQVLAEILVDTYFAILNTNE